MSKQLINIGGDLNKGDEFYRYKRNIVEVIWENVNGIQTRIKNLELIAKQLGIPSDLLTKYLQKKIGASISGNTIKGKIEIDTIEKHFEQYIKNFILCTKCKLPEWTGKVCKACGFSQGGVEKITLDVEEDKKISEADLEINKIMHFLYDLRENPNITLTSEQLEWVDRALDLCWEQSENCKWEKTISKINKKFEEIGLQKYERK